MLSLPMHKDIISPPSLDDCIKSSVMYKTMDGNMYAIVGESWTLNEMPISIGWYSSKGIPDKYCQETIASALRNDVATLTKITTDSSYFYGKALARAARLALIAEEVGALDLLRPIRDFLAESMTPWMEGSLTANALLYDEKWGGLTTRNGSVNSGADFGFGVYNDHHYHLGYFCYAGAVLSKLDPTWGCTYRAHLYTIVEDFMASRRHDVERPKHTAWLSRGPLHHHHTTAARGKPLFPRFRNFDFWVLHSWAGGLTEFMDGRNQESTNEAVNAYYLTGLLGLAFGDSHLMNTGLTLAALEIRVARALWHVPSDSTIYEQEFSATQRIVGVLWANKRETRLWFAPSEWKECRLGIQLLPIIPITEVIFQDMKYVQELVQWTLPANKWKKPFPPRNWESKGRRYCTVPSNKRKATICMETWQFFRKEMRLRINIYPQQKEAAQRRIALRHTSRLGRMGRDGFVATFVSTDHSNFSFVSDTYCGYRALCQTLIDSPDPLEQHSEADMVEVARQEAEGRCQEAERRGGPITGHDRDGRDIVGDGDRSATVRTSGDGTSDHEIDDSDSSSSDGSHSDPA
ncbi:hypothetical protein L7F22_055645 [Adiantum nelumboides]|nr:hypothetical protein [Adiantum nelumboides]